jgi:two-component system response regulator FlrC
VAINCAAIPENMLEGMLFGHEKGAFTGAYSSAPGKFEQANGGTLLLDEISEMDISLQAKILRVIQEREVERLGGRKVIDLDVRIVATTNRQLEEEVRAGRFREDLYYRLSVFPLQWLPLRDRRQDIVPLAQKLLQMHTNKMGRTPVDLDASAKAAIQSHGWPGNVRELDNVVQRALIMQSGNVISDFHLRLDPFGMPVINTGADHSIAAVNAAAVEADGSDSSNVLASGVLEGDLQRREFEIIVDTLRNEGGSRKHTAERLGISPRTLRYKLARMRDIGINVESALQGA